ncbi:uncharacterized protein LOC134005858 isoform X3 [Scomber scombrus]|uniref:uncharacterized protein LOC134005858 isoform X3 n=1 Tax=Scomber scombrus TaxID=13677 RepID=UPI002DDB6CAB|nr:uncharacterized protein LOC134005858 isoform X3 [Scomber scombrus]
MEIFRDDTEFTDIQIVRVVDMFERRPHMQRIMRCGLLGIEYEDDSDVTDDDDDDDDDDDYETGSWVHCHNNFHGNPRLPDSSDRGLSGNHTRSSSTLCQSPLCNYNGCEPHYHSPSIQLQEKESDTEREARLLQDAKKSKEQTEKKRIKRQKQKERRRQERLDKEKLNPVKNGEGTDDPQLSKADKKKQVNAESKDGANTRVKEQAAAKDTESSDGSENESSEKDSDKDDSGDSEELDLTSTFVSKAALIARRKLEQKSRPERKEKKKIAVKEETKTVPGKPNENQDVVKKQDSAEPSSPTFEDNVKISSDLAVIGNQYASAGNYNMAVKYFTDAIKYNPTEFKLFGNRSFCFEKMQEYEKALTDAELSLSMYPGWVKGLFRKGRALAGLKRYEEASQGFREVLKMDSACAEAAQELMRVQMTQLMDYGFTREQSSNALIIHGTANKALEALLKLKQQAGAVQNGTLPPVQVANVTGTSPVLSANTNPAPAFPTPLPPPQSKEAPKTLLKNNPLGPVQNMSNVPSEPKPISKQAMTSSEDQQSPPELFPVWVGNLFHQVSESLITNLFNKVGAVYSTKLLSYKRCAFVNYTKQEYCDEAIRRFNGFELMGIKIAVRYPDRIPHGMGISKSALKAEDLQDENMRQREYVDWNGGVYQRPFRPYRHHPNFRGPYSY